MVVEGPTAVGPWASLQALKPTLELRDRDACGDHPKRALEAIVRRDELRLGSDVEARGHAGAAKARVEPGNRISIGICTAIREQHRPQSLADIQSPPQVSVYKPDA